MSALPDRDAITTMWLAGPLPREVRRPLERLAKTPDVVRIAVMPDIHYADDVCVGVVVGTRTTLLPQAVGSDVGCGMTTVSFDAEARAVDDPRVLGRILDAIGRVVPANRHGGPTLRDALPAELDPDALSDPTLASVARRDGRVQFATLGRGNHFLELQVAENGVLWALVHSGSRAVGPAILHHAVRRAGRGPTGLASLLVESDAGRAYGSDIAWALRYAEESRRAMLDAVCTVLADVAGVAPNSASAFSCVHNLVRAESHAGEALLVHRKGAAPAAAGTLGVIPGSMGTATFHVEGRGEPRSMASSSHGAGRAMARSEARRRVGPRELRRQMGAVVYDRRRERDLVEEAPAAYRDIGAVMRAQKDLVRVVRRLRPLLCYKGS